MGTVSALTKETPRSLSIVWRGDGHSKLYEEARVERLFNRHTPKRYPLAIVFAKKESDIVDAVKLAIQKKCCVSIRAGAHSWPAWSIRDGTILVDLKYYSETTLDKQTSVACISPSTIGRDAIAYLSARGRTLSVGHCPDVGI